MNIENTLELAQFIEKEAESIRPEAKVIKFQNVMVTFTRETPCGTVGCLMGSYTQMKGIDFDYREYFEDEITLKFENFLDIPTCGSLINVFSWHKEWKNKYFEATNLYEEMLVMSGYLRFLAEKERQNKCLNQ